jgi:dTDP-4-amino-4,6-dideoxygalactose transaminase
LYNNDSALTKWSFDLNLSEQDIGYEVLKRCPLPYGMKRVHEFEKEVENEGGSEHDIAVNKAAQALLQRKRQHAMAQAMSPGKQLLMVRFTSNYGIGMIFPLAGFVL